MTKERIDKAVDIINYAIEHGISVKESSVKNGYADTYVKNVKSTLVDKYDSDTIDDELYSCFMEAYENYESSRKPQTQVTTNEFISSPKGNKIENEQTLVSRNGDKLSVEWKGFNNDFSEGEEETPERYGYPNGHIKTLNQLLERCDVNLDEWAVDRYIVNKWDVTAFKNGYPETWENFQVKATLEKIKEVYDAKRIAQVFENLVKNYKPPVTSYNPSQKTVDSTLEENNLLEVSLFDLHIGKLGWAGEVGENYDTKIAVARFQDAIKNLMKRAEGFKYSRILFPIGNDFFNSDNQYNTTSNGTPQDEDLRWQKTFSLGCQLIIDGIELLKKSGVPVDVVVIPGNHDFERSYYLGTVIDAWFRNDEQVNINNGANPRKYYQFGEVLLGLTHGNNEKENSLPLLMATEQKELWGRTTFHEWHLGHYHKKRNVKFTVFDKAQVLNEELGVTVRYLSSLTGTEEWHYKKGYVGSQKAGEAFVWNDKTGMIGHLNFNFTDFDREH